MTNLTISELNQAAPKGASSLSELWHEVEKKRLRNQRYTKKLDDFLEKFKQEMESTEQDVCRATEQWVNHLLTFVPKKSFTKAQRQELYDWIDEEMDLLTSNPFNPYDSEEMSLLQLKVHKVIRTAEMSTQKGRDEMQQKINMFRAHFADNMGFEFPFSDAEILEMLDDPAVFQQKMEQFFEQQAQEEIEDDNENIEWEWHHAEADEQSGSEDVDSDAPRSRSNSDADSLALFENKAITRLYRHLAKQFHPDKELDPQKKIEKKELMQRLSEAKKNKDAIAMLLLAQEYSPEHTLNLEEGMLQRLEAAMKYKITELNQAHKEMQHGHDFRTRVWKKFGRGSKASRQEALDNYRQSLQQETSTLLHNCIEVNTIKKLKQELDARILSRDPFAQMDLSKLLGHLK